MPFETLETETKFNRPLQAAISYMRAARKGEHKKGSKPRLLITIPSVLSALSKKKFFMLQLGKGVDLGKARVVGQAVGNKCTIMPKNLKHSFVYDFGYVPMLGDEIAGLEHIAVRKISDDEFEIDLPPWFVDGTAGKTTKMKVAG